MRRRLPWLLFAASVLLNIGLFLRSIDAASGGGRYSRSPDGKYVAQAFSLRNWWFSSDRDIYGRLSLHPTSRDGGPLVEVVITPEHVLGEMEYRNIEDLIEWSEDSSKVCFRTPSGVFTVNVPEKSSR